jgi:hypothetical protein
LLASSSAGSISSPRSLQRAKAVQVKIIPVSSNRRQPALLAQLFRQEPREPARALARSTIYCPLHRHIGHHKLGSRCWSRSSRQRDRTLDGGCRKRCWK